MRGCSGGCCRWRAAGPRPWEVREELGKDAPTLQSCCGAQKDTPHEHIPLKVCVFVKNFTKVLLKE